MLISLAVPIKVLLHLECFNELNNMYHIGISFHEKTRNIRFDYRAFNDGRSYETTEKQRLNVYDMFPDNPLKSYTDQKLYVQLNMIIYWVDNQSSLLGSNLALIQIMGDYRICC